MSESLTTKQLETNAQAFIDELNKEPSADISRIIAGMTTIIEGNEAAYESIKKQKWFERIWYGITGKNKATVAEMKSKRELLTKYTIQILVKMNNMMQKHSECIYDIYRALAVIRHDMDGLVEEVNSLVHKLNDKINSVDNYIFIVTEIQNKKYDINSPLLSLIDIMSIVDSRTAKDTKKLQQLKETMEKAGFDFSMKIDIPTYSKEILSLPEDRVGRILLFCQSFSHRSRFLKYTASLMENYYYLGESDRQIVRESGEAVDSALRRARITNETNCLLGSIFNDIQDGYQQDYQLPQITMDVQSGISQADSEKYIANEKPISLIIIGKVDCEKNTLITKLREKYPLKFKIREIEGLSLSSNNNDNAKQQFDVLIKQSNATVVLYCVSSPGGRFENYERDFIKELSTKYSNTEFIVVLTQCFSKKTSNELKEYIQTQTSCSVICVLADTWQVDEEISIEPFGIDELVETINRSAL